VKKKLNILFILIGLALLGIIISQACWSITAYSVNRNRFDMDIDVAMQKAMDDCKKDYFDSIRVVLVKRLSDTAIKISVDTLHEDDTIHKQLTINIKSSHNGPAYIQLPPFHITSNQVDYYRAMIKHKATWPEILTEASFYIPTLMNQWQMLLGLNDIQGHWAETEAFLKSHSNIPRDTVFARGMVKRYGIYALPVNYRQADSIKLNNYFKLELAKMNITSAYQFHFSPQHIKPRTLDVSYSETLEYDYKFNGFIFLGVSERNAEFFCPRGIF